MGKRKVFVGIKIPDEVKKQLWGITNSLQKFGYPISWTNKDKYHITLIYLGYITEKKLDALFKLLQVEGLKFQSIKIKLGQLGAFPSIINPRVVTAKINEGEKDLNNIYHELFSRLKEEGFLLEEKEFESHITLGRLKNDDPYLKRKVSEMIIKAKVFDFKVFEATNISLFESLIVNKQSVYQVLLSVPMRSK